MALKSLFNLDPSRFSIRPGAGSFRRVADTGQKQLSLADLLGDLQTPTVPENIPKVNPVDTDAISGFMSTFGPAKSAREQLGAQLAAALKTSLPVAYTRLDTNFRPSTVRFADEQYLVDIQNKYDPYRSVYNTGNTQYESTYKPQIDTYNQEVSAYKDVVDPFKAELDAYNTEATRRTGEYNTALVNPNRVDKKRSETTGDVLADSDLYSENLHNMMIDRISAQPVIDEMSSLFSSAKGK